MPNLKVKYFDRETDTVKIINIPSDILTVIIPQHVPTSNEEEGTQPALEIQVNTDSMAITLPEENNALVCRYDYTEELLDWMTDASTQYDHPDLCERGYAREQAAQSDDSPDCGFCGSPTMQKFDPHPKCPKHGKG